MWEYTCSLKSNAFTSPDIESEYSKNDKDNHFGLLLKKLKTRLNRQRLHKNRQNSWLKSQKKSAKPLQKRRQTNKDKDKQVGIKLDKSLTKYEKLADVASVLIKTQNFVISCYCSISAVDSYHMHKDL